MNDKDEKSFEKWFMYLDDSHLNRVIKLNRGASQKAWQAACEYKDEKNNNHEVQRNKVFVKMAQEVSELQAENKKLREALEFYANATNNPKQYMRQGYLVYNLKKAIFVDGGTIAQEALAAINGEGV